MLPDFNQPTEHSLSLRHVSFTRGCIDNIRNGRGMSMIVRLKEITCRRWTRGYRHYRLYWLYGWVSGYFKLGSNLFLAFPDARIFGLKLYWPRLQMLSGTLLWNLDYWWVLFLALLFTKQNSNSKSELAICKKSEACLWRTDESNMAAMTYW